ncbi:MAG: two-component system, chemotaxis family, chemotaxis protein CheY [Pseudomonadota bacterium]|nr:two-component system, chemotaxis family, chemotaxis protein CheY [Pseudomonadota bacterium]
MKKILVIDDAATVRMYYRQVLEAEGFAVEEAGNGYEGLEKALTEAFDLYIVDINMPKMDGYTLLRTIRQEPTICATPAIMISTEGQIQDANAAYAAGANLYFNKPVRPESLITTARLLTGEHRA